jgi:dTDP-4-dehydrorhamnose 3,5-epimerase
MIFTETKLKGACVIDLEPREDERGFFARTFCAREFEEHGLNSRLVQGSISFNKQRGTLRGMHWQEVPHGECKLIRVTRGAIHDVIIDLRRDSGTCRQWFGVELTAENRRQLYVPAGFAHGFQTLSDNTEVTYQMSEFFAPESSRGVRWNDPAFAIDWPQVERRVMNERDASYPDFVS